MEKKARKAKQSGTSSGEEALLEELEAIPRPQWRDIVPLQIVRLLIWLIVSVPSCLSSLKDVYQKRKQETFEPEEDESEEDCKQLYYHSVLSHRSFES